MKKIAVVVILITLILSSTFAGAGIVKNGKIKSYVSLGGETEIYVYGKDFKNIEGEWIHYGNHAVRMSSGSGDCTVIYEINIGTNKVVDGSLQVGIYFCDQSWFGDGPSLGVYNWQTGYTFWDNVGKWGNLEWVWKTTLNSNGYVGNTGIVRIEVFAEGNDDTILDLVGVKFIPAAQPPPPRSKLDCIGSLNFHHNTKPNSTINGSFTVKNIGDPDSKLDWKVEGYPGWGTWSFNPSNGSDLASGSSVTVNVLIKVPDQKGQIFEGAVIVFNTENSSNYDTIRASVSTDKAISSNAPHFVQFMIEKLVDCFPLLERLLQNLR